MRVLDALGHALAVAGSMTWQVTWSLILGFTLSAVVQAVIRRSTVVRLMGDDRPKSLAAATGLGAASSSCSYAAVALARILALLIGWQFTLAEFIGGPIMIVLMAVAFRLFVRKRLIRTRRASRRTRGWPGPWKATRRWT